MNVNDLKYTVSVSDVYGEAITDSLLDELGVEVVDFRVPIHGELLLCLDRTLATRDGYWAANAPRLILRRVPTEYVTDGVRKIIQKGDWLFHNQEHRFFQAEEGDEFFGRMGLVFTRREVK